MEFETLYDDIVRDVSTNIISVSTKLDKTSRGLGYEYFKSMERNKDKVAQIIADTGETDTYDELLKRVVRTALHLRERHLAKDDVVCLCSYNQLHNVVPFLACIFLGIPVASLDPSFTVSDSTPLIKLIKPKLFFIVPEVIEMIKTSMEEAEVESEVVVYGDDVDTDKYTPFDKFLEPHIEEDLFRPVSVKDDSETAVIFFSSGTTGLPKGICCTYKTMYHQGMLMGHLGWLGSESVSLVFSTLFWVSSAFTLSGIILHGSTRLVVKTYDPQNTWYLLDKYKVTYSFLAPIQAYTMLSVGRPKGIDTSKLNVIVTGGSHVTKEKLNEFRALLPGTFIAQGYGCTEICGFIACFSMMKTKDKLLLNNRPESCGRPQPGFEYKVVDTETERNCGPNEKGEIRIKTEFLLNGYYGQDSSSAFDEEGWLRTGDLGYFDEDCCFYIVARMKELLKFRSWQVPPAIIEGVLQEHPSVKQCVVIGVPDEIDGDLPLAVIVLYEKYLGNVTAEEIQDFVAERVNDTHKLRGGVIFLDVLPVTPSGKVRKKDLRDMVLKKTQQ